MAVEGKLIANKQVIDLKFLSLYQKISSKLLSRESTFFSIQIWRSMFWRWKGSSNTSWWRLGSTPSSMKLDLLHRKRYFLPKAAIAHRAMLWVSRHKEQDLCGVPGQIMHFLFLVPDPSGYHQKSNILEGKIQEFKSQLSNKDKYRRSKKSSDQNDSKNENARAKQKRIRTFARDSGTSGRTTELGSKSHHAEKLGNQAEIYWHLEIVWVTKGIH